MTTKDVDFDLVGAIVDGNAGTATKPLEGVLSRRVNVLCSRLFSIELNFLLDYELLWCCSIHYSFIFLLSFGQNVWVAKQVVYTK